MQNYRGRVESKIDYPLPGFATNQINGQITIIIIETIMPQEKKYAKISLDQREKLLSLVLDEGFTFKKAADALHMNQSTARMIVRKFQQEGNLFEKKSDRLRRIEVERALVEYRERK